LSVNPIDNDIDDLIGKYLGGEASEQERMLVESWAAENEENKKYLRQMKTIFNKSAGAQHNDAFNADVAWQKVKSRIERRGKVISLRERQSDNLFLKIAASFIILLGIGYLFFWHGGKAADTLKVATEAQAESDTLPDGSAVYLNKQTQLAYHFDKKKNTHVVDLKGEAFFNIHHDDKKNFIIDAGGVFIRDIGTSFNVKAYPDSSFIEVTVQEGEVMFFTDTDSGLYLKKDGRGIFDKKTKKFSIAQPDPNAISYKTRFFNFSDTDLVIVVNTINNIYDEKIILSDSIKNCRITVSFDHEEVSEIANIISETLNLTMERKSDSIYLSGPKCEAQ
jgi:transmembrane sensor